MPLAVNEVSWWRLFLRYPRVERCYLVPAWEGGRVARLALLWGGPDLMGQPWAQTTPPTHDPIPEPPRCCPYPVPLPSRYCEYLPIATTGLFVVESRRFRTLI